MVERFNGRIEEVLQSHHFRSGEELETTLLRYVWLYNQQLPQSALGSQGNRASKPLDERFEEVIVPSSFFELAAI